MRIIPTVLVVALFFATIQVARSEEVKGMKVEKQVYFEKEVTLYKARDEKNKATCYILYNSVGFSRSVSISCLKD